MARYKDGNSPEHKREPVKPREKYPMGTRMKKGSELDCLACKGKNSSCKGCGGSGKIVV
jgi:hypothetical protein